jgi:FkbM family methyltransferase
MHADCKPFVRGLLDRQVRMTRHVYASDGLSGVAWELAYQCVKPLLRIYTKAAWRWCLRRRQSSVAVLGHRLAILPRDRGVSIELAVHGMHEPRATRLMSSCLRPGMVAIDIGANIGYFALLEARLVGRNGKVIAVEPVPENARVFLHNVKSNGYSNVRLEQIAISDRNGVLQLHLSAKSNWHSLNPVPWPTSDLPVQASTLDALLAGQSLSSVDLVRMDLEGHEIAVIDGMRETIEKHSPRLFVELHPHIVGGKVMVQYLQKLEELGYTPEWVLDQERDVPWRWLFLSPERPKMSDLLSDWRINTHPRALTVMFNRNISAI